MDRKCDSDMGITQSRHSRRNVPMTLSQIVFAFGLRCGDLNTSTPRRLTDSPRCVANVLLRSCSRYWYRASDPMVSHSCCGVRAAVGCTVTLK